MIEFNYPRYKGFPGSTFNEMINKILQNRYNVKYGYIFYNYLRHFMPDKHINKLNLKDISDALWDINLFYKLSKLNINGFGSIVVFLYNVVRDELTHPNNRSEFKHYLTYIFINSQIYQFPYLMIGIKNTTYD